MSVQLFLLHVACYNLELQTGYNLYWDLEIRNIINYFKCKWHFSQYCLITERFTYIGKLIKKPRHKYWKVFDMSAIIEIKIICINSTPENLI